MEGRTQVRPTQVIVWQMQRQLRETTADALTQMPGVQASLDSLKMTLTTGHADENALAYLIKPIKQADLEPAITIAVRRFEQFEALRREASDLRQALEDRKMIERAKGILMKRSGIEEPDAFRRLQKLASDKNRKLAEVARMIVTTEEAFAPS